MLDALRDMKVTETGVGILVKGDKAVDEHMMIGKHDDRELDFLAVCIYSIKNGKIWRGFRAM